jgi:hypothetical protein
MIFIAEQENYKWLTFDELIKLTPKHFGLKGLLANDLNSVKKYML